MGIRLLGGRDFSARDTAGATRVALISRSAARAIWQEADPIGKRISEMDHPGPGDWIEIAGVVDDIHQSGLASRATPAIYYPYLQQESIG
jgi:hypothetical protein